MAMRPYRDVLARPGARALFVVGLVARIPVTAAGLALALHVVEGMRLGWTQAGLVGAVSTLGVAIGSPVAGRFVDRYGLRPVVAVTTAAQLLFWAGAPALPYPALVPLALVAGVLGLPVFSLLRQCVA
jgi:MFS family permease